MLTTAISTMDAPRRRARSRTVNLTSRVLTSAPAPAPPTSTVAPVSRVGGAWTVDLERARHDAQQVIDAIDFSKRDIVIWVPGNGSVAAHPKFEAAVRDSYRGLGSNLVVLQHEASWHLRRSVPTGVATLKLVLEAIRARGGDHRVLVAGEHQGAWIAGEAAADPEIGAVIDRAVLLGHPWLARSRYGRGQDPRVRVINHAGDPLTVRPLDDPERFLDAMVAVHDRRPDGLFQLGQALLSDPHRAARLLGSVAESIPLLGALLRDPSDYGTEMSRAVELLRRGVSG